jgi:hypothetical protein
MDSKNTRETKFYCTAALATTYFFRGETFNFAFFEARNYAALWTEIDHLWFGITKIQSQEKVICRFTSA